MDAELAKRLATTGYGGRNIKKYGLTGTDWIVMMIAQDYACAICRKEFYFFYKTSCTAHIDHNHFTGRVRGLLCHTCNVNLGRLELDMKITPNWQHTEDAWLYGKYDGLYSIWQKRLDNTNSTLSSISTHTILHEATEQWGAWNS